MKKAAPRLALVATPSAFSLQLLSSLSERYSVHSWSASERVVARFREERPEVVVVLCSRRGASQMQELVRSLKTEQRPPQAVLIYEKGLPEDARVVLEASACDGLLGFPVSQEELYDWLGRVFAGERPVQGAAQKPSRLRRAVRRLSGSHASSGDG